jgi:phosphoribosylaminoimidazole carboxylase PurE protein
MKELGKGMPLVGIAMGSKSDLSVMRGAAEILDQLQVPLEVTIRSVHRTPERAIEYAREAQSRGLKIIIAGAGGSAHLPGMIASETQLPVLGVAIKGSLLDGVDSLYSMVRMPKGVPLATIGIDAAYNAGLMAAKILALNDPELAKRLAILQEEIRLQVINEDDQLQTNGWRNV